MFAAFISAILPVMVIALVGAFLSKRTAYLDDPNLPKLVLNVGMPTLLLHSMLGTHIDFLGMGKLVLASVLALAAMVLVTLIVLKIMKLDRRYYLPILVNPNTGNLGIPIAYALLGSDGLAGAVIISSIIEISHFTLGIGMMSGTFNPRRLLANPPVIALIIGAIILGLGIPVPEFVVRIFDMLGSITVPIMLLMLGRSLAHMKVHEAHWGRLSLLALYRPALGFAMAFGAATLLGLSPLHMSNLLIACSMPVAVLNYIFATRFNGPVNEVAGLTFLTLPTAFIALIFIKMFFIGS
ncbi:AEC family transporter [Vibrio tritonius]|uniref:AEC family transporter n=1 Tax=Vibrio tritonius TaxID=1435069 RepID=A0ABS7YVR0_9VIBR|nr:AEC family transporter [Vibrio tritonius]MCA2018544.1 AEC family transporter [Vibrio tritonius]